MTGAADKYRGNCVAVWFGAHLRVGVGMDDLLQKVLGARLVVVSLGTQT